MARGRKGTSHRKTTCSRCGGDLEENRIGRQRYCRGCATAANRESRRRHGVMPRE